MEKKYSLLRGASQLFLGNITGYGDEIYGYADGILFSPLPFPFETADTKCVAPPILISRVDLRADNQRGTARFFENITSANCAGANN